MGVSRTASEINGSFGPKIAIFYTPCILRHSREFSLKFCNGGSAEKLDFPDGGKSVTICAFV